MGAAPQSRKRRAAVHERAGAVLALPFESGLAPRSDADADVSSGPGRHRQSPRPRRERVAANPPRARARARRDERLASAQVEKLTARGEATLENIIEKQRRGGYDVLYLVCHGVFDEKHQQARALSRDPRGEGPARRRCRVLATAGRALDETEIDRARVLRQRRKRGGRRECAEPAGRGGASPGPGGHPGRARHARTDIRWKRARRS